MKRLDEGQVDFFRTFGYIVLREFLQAEDLTIMARELDEGLEVQFPDQPFDGKKRQWTRLTDEGTPYFAALMEDPRFFIPAQQLCGEDVLGIGVDVNRYVGDTGWHPDTGDEEQRAVKFIFYLDPVAATTGALRVIPGSNLLRGEARQRFAQSVAQWPIDQVPAQAVATEPGDIIAFDIRTWHASCGGAVRRAVNLDYFANPSTAADIAKLLDLGRGHASSIGHFGCRRKFNYSRNWLDNSRQSPARQRWIDRFVEIGYLDQPGVGEVAAE
ncbi:MAG: hypothetical protein GKR89_20140 [Candidatus Latescibacteria bacterium]|nr:hypothetical protein [Candidatus Latescibacterota bacterium]